MRRLDRRAYGAVFPCDNAGAAIKATQYIDLHLQEQERYDGQKTIKPALMRQLRTVRSIIDRFASGKKGVLLADDVGMGKTLVACLLAWYWVSCGGRVRILAQSQLLVKHWKRVLERCAPYWSRRLQDRGLREKLSRCEGSPKPVKTLKQGQIHLATYTYARLRRRKPYHPYRTLTCDLLIVDEAHHAGNPDCDGKDNGFATVLRTRLGERADKVSNILLLTATPLSIKARQLKALLDLIGMGEPQKNTVTQNAKTIREWLERRRCHRKGKSVEEIAKGVKDAVDAMQQYVIRHSPDFMTNPNGESQEYGCKQPWTIEVPRSPEATEVLLHAIRGLSMRKRARRGNTRNQERVHHPQFSVSWEHCKDICLKRSGQIDLVLQSKRTRHDARDNVASGMLQLAKRHLDHAIKVIGTQTNPKAVHVARAIDAVLRDTRAQSPPEKVLVFCRHYAAAKEIARAIANVETLPCARWPSPDVWNNARDRVLRQNDNGSAHNGALLLAQAAADTVDTRMAGPLNHITEWITNYSQCKVVLHIPKVSTAERRRRGMTQVLISHRTQLVMALFNSSFGPRVLVTTDCMSEGIDLHRLCRRLVHYELNESVIRVIQREGRIRRLGGLASRSRDRRVYTAMPVLEHTRDEELATIIRDHVRRFHLLFGGIAQLTRSNQHRDPSGEIWESLKEKLHGLRPDALAVVRSKKRPPWEPD